MGNARDALQSVPAEKADWAITFLHLTHTAVPRILLSGADSSASGMTLFHVPCLPYILGKLQASMYQSLPGLCLMRLLDMPRSLRNYDVTPAASAAMTRRGVLECCGICWPM